MKILCVCTGNTCRSPMLAGLLRAELERRHPQQEQIAVESAGTGADSGMPASPEAVACMAELGIDISDHRSRHIDALDLDSYTRVLCMTSGHVAHMRSRGVPAAKLEVVNAASGGVPDPFGGSRRDYDNCIAQLTKYAAAFSFVDPPERYHRQFMHALEAIQKAHALDPKRIDGLPAEALYAQRLQRWIAELVPDASDALQLATHCQHLERWAVPRSEFAADKAGYFTWRKAVQERQGSRATALLMAAGLPDSLVARVAQLVAKTAPKGDAEAQALEDAACLVFLEHELAGFAAEHPDYTRDKLVGIIRKTWRKMSPDGHRMALTIELPDELAELVKAATAP